MIIDFIYHSIGQNVFICFIFGSQSFVYLKRPGEHELLEPNAGEVEMSEALLEIIIHLNSGQILSVIDDTFRYRIHLKEDMTPRKYLNEDLSICQIIKDKKPLVVIILVISSDAIGIIEVMDAANRLIIACEVVISSEKNVISKLERTVSEPIDLLIEIDDIKGG